MFCGTDSTPLRPTLSIAIPFAGNYKICFAYMKREPQKGIFGSLAACWDRRLKLGCPAHDEIRARRQFGLSGR
jgi:hypothetical protein